MRVNATQYEKLEAQFDWKEIVLPEVDCVGTFPFVVDSVVVKKKKRKIAW